MDQNDFDQKREDTELDAQKPVEVTEPVSPSLELNKKKSKKPLLVGGIIAAAVVVLGGGSALAYNMWYQNPDKVLADSLSNMVSRDNLSGDGQLNIDMKDYQATVDVSNKMLNGQMSFVADASFDYEDMTVNLAGSAVYDKDGTVYIKVDKAAELLDTIIDAQLDELGGDMTADEKTMAVGMMKAMFEPIIKKVDGQWIKIVPKDIDKDDDSSDDMKCVSETFNMFSEDEAARTELVDAYKEHKFMVAGEKLGSKDGNLGFTYTLDEKIADEFGKAVEQTKLGKKIASCDEDSSAAETDDATKDAEDELDQIKLEIWVNRWSHQLASLKLTAASTDDQKIDLNYSPNYDQDIKIDVPTEATTLDELTKEMNGMFSL